MMIVFNVHQYFVKIWILHIVFCLPSSQEYSLWWDVDLYVSWSTTSSRLNICHLKLKTKKLLWCVSMWSFKCWIAHIGTFRTQMLLFLVTNMDVEFERWRCRPMAQRQRPMRNWLRVGPILIVLSKLLLLSTGIQKNSLVHLRRVSSLNLCRITVVKVQNIYKKIFTIISSSIFFKV